MNSNQILILMIIITLALSVIMMFPKFFRVIGKLLLNATVGLFAIYLINFALPMENYHVGLNLLSGIVTGTLGLPGIVLLYAVQIIS